MAVRTRASGFRASGNWDHSNFTVNVSAVAPAGMQVAVSGIGGKQYCLGGFRIAGVFTGASTASVPGIVSLYSYISNSNYSIASPLWVSEAGAYEGLSYLESQEFGDGLLLPENAALTIGTDAAFTGGTLKISGVVWGKWV